MGQFAPRHWEGFLSILPLTRIGARGKEEEHDLIIPGGLFLCSLA